MTKTLRLQAYQGRLLVLLLARGYVTLQMLACSLHQSLLQTGTGSKPEFQLVYSIYSTSMHLRSALLNHRNSNIHKLLVCYETEDS